MVFQASKHLKNFRKGQHENLLQWSGVLEDIDTEELIGESKGSETWKKAVRGTLQNYNYCVKSSCSISGTETKSISATSNCF